MQVSILVEVEDDFADPKDGTGLTQEAYERLLGIQTLSPELGWLGEIIDVEQA